MKKMLYELSGLHNAWPESHFGWEQQSQEFS
jgi:hypothetical protein